MMVEWRLAVGVLFVRETEPRQTRPGTDIETRETETR